MRWSQHNYKWAWNIHLTLRRLFSCCSRLILPKVRISDPFVRRIRRWPVDSPHRGPATLKMFPYHDVIMTRGHLLRKRQINCRHSMIQSNSITETSHIALDHWQSWMCGVFFVKNNNFAVARCAHNTMRRVRCSHSFYTTFCPCSVRTRDMGVAWKRVIVKVLRKYVTTPTVLVWAVVLMDIGVPGVTRVNMVGVRRICCVYCKWESIYFNWWNVLNFKLNKICCHHFNSNYLWIEFIILPTRCSVPNRISTWFCCALFHCDNVVSS